MWIKIIQGPFCVMLFVGLFLLGWSVPAYADAINDCDSCCQNNCGSCKHGETNCVEKTSGRCTLHADITCDSSDPGIYLDDNANLDMIGHDITCSGTCNYAAVTAPAGETNRVYNSDGSFESAISGAFAKGVDCDNDKADQVDGIAIGIRDGVSDPVTDYGTHDCRKVFDNVIVGDGSADSVGIWHDPVATSDQVTDNYIEGFDTGIDLVYSVAIDVQRNVLHTGSMGIAIDLFGGTAQDVSDNIFLGTGADASAVLIDAGTNFSGNIADVDHPDFEDCVDDGKCVGLTAPYPGSQ
jgi:hypothetical protein